MNEEIKFEKWWDSWGKCPGDGKNNYRKLLAREGWINGWEAAIKTTQLKPVIKRKVK